MFSTLILVLKGPEIYFQKTVHIITDIPQAAICNLKQLKRMYGIPQNSSSADFYFFLSFVLKESAPVDQQKDNFYFKLIGVYVSSAKIIVKLHIFSLSRNNPTIALYRSNVILYFNPVKAF